MSTTSRLLTAEFASRLPGLPKRRYTDAERAAITETLDRYEREVLAPAERLEQALDPTFRPSMPLNVLCLNCGKPTPNTGDPHPTCTRCLALDKDRGIECR